MPCKSGLMREDNCMRLFLGIDLPDQLKSKIENHLSPLKQTPKGWENEHDFHMTMLFIGETAEEKLEEIKSKLATLTFEPFELKIVDIEFFPRRIMYLSMEDSENLLKLKNQTDEFFPEYVRPNEKAFHPHITVKRWQRYEFNQLEKDKEKLKKVNFTFLVKKLCLFKSEKNVAGEKYHVIFQSS